VIVEGYSCSILSEAYCVRLVRDHVIFDPDNAVLLVVAAGTGFVVNPSLYAWLGVVLRRGST
jgi:hypothetical protein